MYGSRTTRWLQVAMILGQKKLVFYCACSERHFSTVACSLLYHTRDCIDADSDNSDSAFLQCVFVMIGIVSGNIVNEPLFT